jgi:tetratricopeptide (TPR) repeat protein
MKVKKKNKNRVLLLSLSDASQPVELTYEEAMTRTQTLIHGGSIDEGDYLLRQIAAAMPRELSPQIQLLRVCSLSLDFSQASERAVALLKKAPRDVSVLCACAEYYRQAGDVNTAVETLERALLFRPDHSASLNELATCHAVTGDRAKAEKYYRAALRAAPRSLEIYWYLASLGACNAADILVMESAVAKGGLDRVRQTYLCFALAAASRGVDIGKEKTYLNRANGLVAAERAWNSAEFLEQQEAYLGMIDEDTVSCAAEVGTEDYAPIFIVGVPRSGTTLLEQMLGAHPALTAVGESGAFFRANHLAALDLQSQVAATSDEKELLKTYCRNIHLQFQSDPLINKVGGGQVVDKSVNNIHLIGLILLVWPNARVIHLTRDPRDVCLSCYRQFFSVGQEFSYDLASCAEYCKLHAGLMQQWKTLFPDRIASLEYETLVAEPEQAIKQLLSYCGLEWDPACLNYFEGDQSINTASHSQASQPVYTSAVGAWREYADLLEPALDKLAY